MTDSHINHYPPMEIPDERPSWIFIMDMDVHPEYGAYVLISQMDATDGAVYHGCAWILQYEYFGWEAYVRRGHFSSARFPMKVSEEVALSSFMI